MKPFCAVAVLAALLPGCGCSPSEALSEPLDLTIGTHRLQLVPPIGWEHIDHGREHRFEHDRSHISIADIGPATGAGMAETMVHARSIYRAGQLDDARTLLRTLDPRPAFPSEERWLAVSPSWTAILKIGDLRQQPSPEEIESAFARVLVEIETLDAPDLPTMVRSALPRLDHNERRDIAEERAMTIGGRRGWQVDTWDRLNHTGRKRHLFVLNQGRLLVARMESGTFSEMESTFDLLATSLQFPVTD